MADAGNRSIFCDRGRGYFYGTSLFSVFCSGTGNPSYHVRTLVEGLIRIGIFVLYILLISRMEDIQRTFMYHGAEHKCINCIEHGLPLTVENVRISSRQHKRCGTSFLFFVLAISILLLFLIQVESTGMRVLIRILLLPVIAGSLMKC